jgi:hypothetical protein
LVEDRFRQAREAIEAAVLRGPGRTAPELRQAAARRGELPPELKALVAKIHDHAYRIGDEELAGLRQRYSEDELFEVVVASALGAALHRLEAGLRALGDAT